MQKYSGLNYTMLCDFYELTMGNGYFEAGLKDKITYFDLFYRTVPDGGGCALAAGLEQAIDYIRNLHFSEEDIDYLRGRGMISEAFLDYLRHFKFTGDVWAMPEGTPVFPREPIMVIRAPAIQAQLLETFLLLTINHQSLIATKANRIVRAADGRVVLEFGSRRAQGPDAAVLGARAAFIGGCAGTACVLSDQIYGVAAGGTMAHSWVQMFPTQLDAFRAYCKTYPQNATLLVDTYDTLRSGVPDAIRAFNEVLKPLGITKCGIRLDSGDMAYLTKRARKMLDDAGWPECKITCSNSLDEHLIKELLRQGACIDSFGVGERLITSRTSPVFLQRLLEAEVPEIHDGLITVRKIARMPGERAKIAVESYDDRIDPVGACVGVKGSRVHGIVRELRGENIDVINYTQNISLFITRALSPATVNSVRIHEEERKAEVYLNPDQVSLAIGKSGLNIKLASMLTEYTIDVFREIEGAEGEGDDIYLDEFVGDIDQWIIDALKGIGMETAKDVLNAPREMLVSRADLEEETVDEVLRILAEEFEEE